MGLLAFLKEARWTKNLDPKTRADAEYVLALKNFEKMQQAIRRGKLSLTDPSVLAREIRMNQLDPTQARDVLPRMSPRMERLLGMNDPVLKRFRREPPINRGPVRFPGSPKPPPKVPPTWGQNFMGHVSARASALRDWAAKRKLPLGVAAAGATAAGLGVLGVHAATKKRHDALQGKSLPLTGTEE